MTRLTHSFDAFARKLQMSSTQVFIFVEGQTNDAYFYGEICDRAFHHSNVSYDIRLAKELPPSTGRGQGCTSGGKVLAGLSVKRIDAGRA